MHNIHLKSPKHRVYRNTKTGDLIVAEHARRFDGVVGVYGCPDFYYRRTGDFSCGARYYFGEDLNALELLP